MTKVITTKPMATHLVSLASLASQVLARFLAIKVSATPAMAPGQARALSGLEQYHGDQENRGRHVHNAQNQLGDIHAASSFRPRMGHHSSIRYGLWAQLSRAAFKRGFYRSTFPRRFQAFFRISQPPRTIRRLPQQVARK